MHNAIKHIKKYLYFSPLALCSGAAAILAITYIGLIAVVMNYGALTIEYSQSARNQEAVVAELEGRYLATVANITSTDYATLGYTVPSKKTFVQSDSMTALR